MLPGSEWGKGMIDVAVTKQRHGMGSPGVWQWQTTVEPYWTIFSITFCLMTHIELSRWGYYWLKLTGVSQIAKLVRVGWWQNDEWRVDVVSRHWDIEKHWVVNGLMLLEILCGMYNNRGKIFLNHRKKKTTTIINAIAVGYPAIHYHDAFIPEWVRNNSTYFFIVFAIIKKVFITVYGKISIIKSGKTQFRRHLLGGQKYC